MKLPERFGHRLICLGLLMATGCSGASPALEASPTTEDAITNTQEAGVDEGGIVKAWNDHLIVLRRGRLFTVDLTDQRMQPLCAVDAFAPGEEPASWYDEMLVSDDTVVVVGYTYELGATELGLFSLDEQGCPHHQATYWLQSNDYYSSRNYASRLVDGQLVFYMPHWLGDYEIEDGQVVAENLPKLGRVSESLFSAYDWDEIVSTTQIEVPPTAPNYPTLHTVISCDMSGSFTCQGHGIIGEFGRSFYVSGEAVYIWVSDSYSSGISTVYRMPLDGGPTGSVNAWGAPIDQFSFHEEESGYLDVLVRSESNGDWMWGPEVSTGALALARIPPSAFTARPGSLPQSAYTPLPSNGSAYRYGLHNRFVGDTLLYSIQDSYYGYYDANARMDGELFIYDVHGQGQAQAIRLPHHVERIEPLGGNAIVIGGGQGGLQMTTIELGSAPRVVGTYLQPGVSQGEQRSHGFFFRQDAPDQGVLGLPLQLGNDPYAYLEDSSIAVLYVSVDDLNLQALGMLGARGDSVQDNCLASCVDWYGNSRPIFYRGRVFALMGYELVEGTIVQNLIRETGRVHLLTDQPSWQAALTDQQ